MEEPLPQLGSGLGGAKCLLSLQEVKQLFVGSQSLPGHYVQKQWPQVSQWIKNSKCSEKTWLALPREPKCTTDDDELSTATVFSWRRQERGARQWEMEGPQLGHALTVEWSQSRPCDLIYTRSPSGWRLGCCWAADSLLKGRLNMDHLVSTKTETQTSGGSPEDCSADERGDCLCQITVRLGKKVSFPVHFNAQKCWACHYAWDNMELSPPHLC